MSKPLKLKPLSQNSYSEQETITQESDLNNLLSTETMFASLSGAEDEPFSLEMLTPLVIKRKLIGSLKGGYLAARQESISNRIKKQTSKT